MTQTLNWSGGLPWTPSIGECGTVSDAGPCRPDKVVSRVPYRRVSVIPRRAWFRCFTPSAPLTYALNPSLNGQDSCSFARPTSAAFALPACGTIGNVGLNSFRGPRGLWSDFSLAKNFATSPSATLRSSASMLTTSLTTPSSASTAARATPAWTAAATPVRSPTSRQTAPPVRRLECGNCSLVCVSLSNPEHPKKGGAPQGFPLFVVECGGSPPLLPLPDEDGLSQEFDPFAQTDSRHADLIQSEAGDLLCFSRTSLPSQNSFFPILSSGVRCFHVRRKFHHRRSG